VKNIFTFTISILLLFIGLTGCRGQGQNQTFQIEPMVLTEEQQNILNLISTPNQEILLFNYNIDEQFTSIEFWVEVFRYGELAETVAGLRMYSQPPIQITEGQLAVTINITQNRNFQWTISSSGGSFQNSEPWTASETHLGRAHGPIIGPVTIENGRIIVLHTSIFSNGYISTFTDQQIYLEQPELLAEYPYVHMILARFSY